MSVLRSDYNIKKKVEEVWYDSSNVVHSKFVEYEDTNSGDLYVVFKGGKQYLYKNVSYQDYFSFKRGLTDGSSGKSLNDYIIKKYPGVKVEDVNLSELMDRLNAPKEEDVTYFVHGDGEVDEDVFQIMYASTLSYAIESQESKFAVQYFDKYGMRSAEYLIDIGVDPGRITIYMPESKVGELDDKFKDCVVMDLKDDVYDEYNVDCFISSKSFEDIGYVSLEKLDEIRKVSRTAYIILRRRMG